MIFKFQDIKDIHKELMAEYLGHSNFTCHDAEFDANNNESIVLIRIDNKDYYAYFNGDLLVAILPR